MSTKVIAVAAVALTALVGGIAYATIPDGNGVIHACFAKSGGVRHSCGRSGLVRNVGLAAAAGLNGPNPAS
jgi:hypothetical protein